MKGSSESLWNSFNEMIFLKKLFYFSLVIPLGTIFILRYSIISSIFIWIISYWIIRMLYLELFFHYRIKNVPRPPETPLLGHILLIKPETLLQDLCKWLSTYGNIVCMRGPIGFPGTVFINSVEGAREIMKKDTPKSLIYNHFAPWLGIGLLTANGSVWKRKRKLITPAFHYKILKKYMSIYQSCANILCKKWKKVAEKGVPVDIFPDATACTLDVIGLCAFNYEINAQKKQSEYVKAIKSASHLFYLRVINPLLFEDAVYYLTPNGRKFLEHCRVIHELPDRVIKERRIAAEKGEIGKGKYIDFLDLLLLTKDENGKPLSDTEIRNEVDTFMFEGHDTTASGLASTLYCLSRNPEYQEKAYEEIMSVFGDKDEIEYEDLAKLEFLGMCIKEAIRLYPPVPSIIRHLNRDITVEGHLLPEETQVFIIPYAIHRNSQYWKDPEKYDPYRFSPENSKNRDPFSYLPFSAGNRNCIGQAFAMNEEKAITAILLKNFRFKDAKHEVLMRAHVILKSDNGIVVGIEKR